MLPFIRRCALAAVIAFSAYSSASFAADSRCEPFIGAILISPDGKYLGKLTDKYDSDSIFNKYGNYGSKYNSDSIWNNYGSYGGKYSSNSPFNPYTSDAPRIIKDRQIIGTLTKNKYVSGAVDPIILSALCFDYTPD